MKNVAHKIISFFMAILLLVATSSFSVYKHFCGDNLVEVSRYTQTDECCAVEIKHKPISILNFSEKECCKNETEITSQLHLENTKPLKLNKNQLVFITSFYYTFINKIEGFTTEKNYYNNFSPPLIVCNKQIEFQTFLI